MTLVGFITELSSTGDERRDFKLFLKVLRQVAHSTINGHGFQGVHFQQNGMSCNVPFFDYSIIHTIRSPVLPAADTPKGVYRHFGGYAALEGEHITSDLFGTYHVPMKATTVKGKKFQPIATIHICSHSLPNEVLTGELTKLPELEAA
ncbi:MAG: hypothetical protein K8T91_04210 [Planctomycetes bacterium]|nr:hypothetical protein [Planctomycetota bacterium]